MSKKSEEAKQAEESKREFKQIVKQGNICSYLLIVPWSLSCVGLGITGGYFLAQLLSMDIIGIGLLLGFGGALGLAAGITPIFIPYFRNIAPLSVLGMAVFLLIGGIFLQPAYWQQHQLLILPTALLCMAIAVHDLMRQQLNYQYGED